ncbi:MAG: M1 family metallopeptidase [bacterium]
MTLFLRGAVRSAMVAGLCASALAGAVAGTVGAQVVPMSPMGASGPARPKMDPTGVGDTSIFAPLVIGTSPSAVRTGSGAPGARYWQNRADYDLKATLDTTKQSVLGEMTLKYTNNSPDTLTFIWLQTEQNAFKANSLNSYIFPQGSRFGARDFAGGYTFSRVEQLLPAMGGKPMRRVAVTTRDNETMFKVNLAEPLAPGRSATINIAYSFPVPEHGADRMGRDGKLYEIAQWYPRVAVYDDVRGWNTEPYLGQGEFYLDYGDFTLSVTVPAGYIVAATGSLDNAKDVLTPAQITRLAEAAKSEKVVNIITADELKSGAARPKKDGMQTWKFTAKNVRDAVWAASPEYQWDASSYKGTMAFAYYRPSAEALWKEAADMSRMSIQEYSERWFQYPWPHISAVEGPISGMEYPMIAMETKSDTKQELYNVVTHEIGHMWFPMIVGSNERVYMWQDEGFNTFINTFSEAKRYPEGGDQMKRAAQERAMIENLMRSQMDRTINVGPDRIDPNLLGFQAYVKPSVGLQLLRQEILGPEAFDDAFRAYTKRWAFKHPTPADFFRTMEDVGGRRLDWFFREWFIENPHFDQGVDDVSQRSKGDTTQVTVVYGNHARGVLPIRARFTFSDGTTKEYDYPAEVWSTNTLRYARQYNFTGKKLVKVELDPDHRLVDTDRSNNVWTASAPPTQP